MVTPPAIPREMVLRCTDVPERRIRTRSWVNRREGAAPVVVPTPRSGRSSPIVPADGAGCWGPTRRTLPADFPTFVRYTKALRSLPDASVPWRPMSVDTAAAGSSEGSRVDVRR
jgi:hypothetical protein